MALSAATVGTVFPKKTFHYGTSDTILYALGIGAGVDGDAADLPFLYEAQLRAFPSQATVIAWDDSWIPILGLNEAMIVHGEQRITLHRPLPATARVSAQSRVTRVVDKGRARGALLYVETAIEEEGAGGLLATLLSTVFARGDGGFGGDSAPGIAAHAVPDRAPDLRFETLVPFNQPFIYRLCGDRNPLHVDPAFARAAGFERPIVHGLSTYGVAVRSIIRSALGNDPDRIEHVAARFSAPVFPGERVETLIWCDGAELSFRMQAAGGGRAVLDNGYVRLRLWTPS
jgi:acyl dehydratase